MVPFQAVRDFFGSLREGNRPMKLYYMPGACSVASHIALHEAGIPVDLVQVGRDKRTSDGQDFNQVNPKGYVPTLELDNGQKLTENVAVLAYIGGLKPDKKLAPAPGTFEHYRLLEWLAFINSELHKNFGTLFASSSEDVKQFAKGNIVKRLTWLNGLIGAKPFLTGEQFTVADCYLFTVLSWAPHVGVDLAQWPAVKAYSERIVGRPAVQAALKAEGLI
jgi:glutathione S-transferase